MEERELSQCIELNQQATMLMAVEKYNEAITYLEKALEMIDQAEKMEGFEVEARNLSFEKAKIYAQKEDVDNSIKYLIAFSSEDTFFLSCSIPRSSSVTKATQSLSPLS